MLEDVCSANTGDQFAVGNWRVARRRERECGCSEIFDLSLSDSRFLKASKGNTDLKY